MPAPGLKAQPLPLPPPAGPAASKTCTLAHRLLPLLLLLLLGTACEVEEENVKIRLTLAERDRLDARIIEHMDSLRPLLESRCAATQEDRVAVATDSIVQRRLEEEARMRARLPQSLQR